MRVFENGRLFFHKRTVGARVAIFRGLVIVYSRMPVVEDEGFTKGTKGARRTRGGLGSRL